jgi:hypothetical protein
MMRQSNARDEAEARFKKKAEQAREGAKAMADYEAAAQAVREKTARLRALRLARETSLSERKRKSAPQRKQA